MAEKKVPWREGLVVEGKGQPDRPARAVMALDDLRRAAREKDPKRRERHLRSAMVTALLGGANEEVVDLSTYKPGPPRGPRWNSDAPLHAFMEETSATTGETRKYALARLAVVHSNVPEDQRENSMRRLARWWASRD